jgi:hypothetical protein
MSSFLEELKEQRWDDHRYYHHSRINQTLHLLSASSFLCAYVLVFKNPAAAVLLAWLFGMTSRQIGHFFFEPRDYDEANNATHEHKEEIKLGYNLQRKVVLMSIWAISPLSLYFNPTLFGLFEPARPPPSSCTTSPCYGWQSVSADFCFARCICSFSRMCRPALCG